jgi:hypothetical protein
MKTRSVESIIKTEYNGHKYTIMVYGEIEDVKEINGYYIVPVTYNAKNMKPKQIEYSKRVCVPGFNEYYSRTKKFNMGWAICAEPDEFSYEEGLKICKRRFSRSPMTTQNGRFLTPDMCQAIVSNESKYIADHIFNFIPNNEEFVEDDNLMCDVEIEFNIADFNKKEDNFIKDNTEKKLDIESKDNSKEDLNYCSKNLNSKEIKNRNFCKYHNSFDTGDIVMFNTGTDVLLGIYKGKVFDRNDGSYLRTEFYFLAPVSENGLIDHDRAKFFDNLYDNNHNFIKADSDGVKLVNDYLLGAHNKMWDSVHKRFKVIF